MKPIKPLPLPIVIGGAAIVFLTLTIEIALFSAGKQLLFLIAWLSALYIFLTFLFYVEVAVAILRQGMAIFNLITLIALKLVLLVAPVFPLQRVGIDGGMAVLVGLVGSLSIGTVIIVLRWYRDINQPG